MFKANADITAADTTLTLTSTSGLYAGLTFRNVVTNEQMRIVSVVNATDIVIQR